jgi:urate oxidase
MEAYAKELADFLLSRNPQVSSAAIRIESTLWRRLTVDGKPHPTTFMRGSNELQTTHVERAQDGAFQIHSGLDNLVILKTANSGFEGYIKDSLTTLKETSDRLFGTAMRAEWHYITTNLDHTAVRSTIREAMLRTFAEHDSKSVQQTLYAMAKSALEATPEIDDIEITMPNKHCLLVDLFRFGQDNPNEIFVPTDEPHGYIEARVRRTS